MLSDTPKDFGERTHDEEVSETIEKAIDRNILMYCEPSESSEYTKKLIKLIKKSCGWEDKDGTI